MSNKKTALITGASRGIGRAIAYEFSQNGYRLFRELSDIVHGDSVENYALGLVKYKALKCLVVGILDNVKVICDKIFAYG